MPDQFTVVSGKHEVRHIESEKTMIVERNYKYIHSFQTLDEALVEWNKNHAYAFNDIEFEDANGKTWILTLTEAPEQQKHIGE